MSEKPPFATAEPNVLYETEGCVFGTWRNIFVVTWTTRGTGPLVDLLAAETDVFAKAHSEGFSVIHVIAKNPPLPTSEARDKLIAETQKFAPQLACVGTVLEGSGFWASAVRSFVVGIRLLVPRTFEMQTYASIAEIAAWLPPLHTARTGVAMTPTELEHVLVTLRRRLD